MVSIGLETLLHEKLNIVAHLRLGLVASAASVDAKLTSSLERLNAEPNINLVALFAPEHGLRGEAQAGKHLENYTDSITQLPVYSLYGATYQPTADMLSNLDAILFDVQDAGLRFYTYLSTLAHLMQTAAEHDKQVLVLDRPIFLNGVTLEGNILNPAYASFVGMYPLPMRYGMTAGEIATLLNTHFAIGCELTVVPMRNYKRQMWFDQTGLPFVPPSPNLPTLNAIHAYAGNCLFEGSNISEGRGTTKPFEYIGAPFINGYQLTKAVNKLELAGVRFREVTFIPTFSKHQGQLCHGVQLYITDRDRFQPVATTLHLLKTIRHLFPDFAWLTPQAGKPFFIDQLAGTSQLRAWLETGEDVNSLIDSWQVDLAAFAELRQAYLIYH